MKKNNIFFENILALRGATKPGASRLVLFDLKGQSATDDATDCLQKVICS